jgi:hypothetical protein
MLAASHAGAEQLVGEYQVKAAYLLNFARFVAWSAEALPAAAPLRIVIVGDDPFDGALEQVIYGKLANGHPIQLGHSRWNEVLPPCHVVFISNSEERHLSQILRSLEGRSVLTVSDIDRFALRGGIIEFRMVGNRVRFDINEGPAAAARLGLSSKLLGVARLVFSTGGTVP